MPDPSKQRMIITGAASGIGLEAALQLASQGHHILIADRDTAGATTAVRRIVDAGGTAEARELDLGDLGRVHQFAEQEVANGMPLDVLINNAGLLPPSTRATTKDGFELAFGVSYLGHFALTGLLLPSLRRSREPRVVSVSSLSHASGRIDFDDMQFEKAYNWSAAYESSKLACLVFATELDRRRRESGGRLLSVAVHPGISRTPIGVNQKRAEKQSVKDKLDGFAFKVAMRYLGQTAAEGAVPLVYAATAPDVQGGRYYGPTGFLQASGTTGELKPGKPALVPGVGEKLWAVGESLSGVVYSDLP